MIPDEILTLVKAAVPGVTVYDGMVPDTPPDRYAVVYLGHGMLRALAVCGTHDSVTVRWQVTTVAPDGGMVRWLATTIRDRTAGIKPTVDGWSCGQIVQDYDGSWSARNEAVMERPVVYITDQYKLLASRA